MSNEVTKSIGSKLTSIQCDLVAPKDKNNSFGKYKYRTLEGIVKALKPHLKTNNCRFTLTDDIIMVGNRIYVKATATITCNETGEFESVSAMARESESKKGMDDSQITGTASSYARKYAANGLFCIDDSKDIDSHDNNEPTLNKKVNDVLVGIPTIFNAEINNPQKQEADILAQWALLGDFDKKQVWSLFDPAWQDALQPILKYKG